MICKFCGTNTGKSHKCKSCGFDLKKNLYKCSGCKKFNLLWAINTNPTYSSVKFQGYNAIVLSIQKVLTKAGCTYKIQGKGPKIHNYCEACWRAQGATL